MFTSSTILIYYCSNLNIIIYNIVWVCLNHKTFTRTLSRLEHLLHSRQKTISITLFCVRVAYIHFLSEPTTACTYIYINYNINKQKIWTRFSRMYHWIVTFHSEICDASCIFIQWTAGGIECVALRYFF